MDIVSSIVAAGLQAQSVRNSTGILAYTHIPILIYIWHLFRKIDLASVDSAKRKVMSMVSSIKTALYDTFELGTVHLDIDMIQGLKCNILLCLVLRDHQPVFSISCLAKAASSDTTTS